jgi:tRNA(Ile2) C34 agmatinyltransferase TiaS
MTATLAAPPPHLRAASAPTLDAVLVEAWNDVTAGAAAECPVCAGRMQPRWSAGAGVVGGRCEDCGATLE